MNIYEHRAKSLLAEFGVAVPRGEVVYGSKEAEKAARSLGGSVFAVKAQIQAGGRGKAGGIKLVGSPQEAAAATEELIGKVLVTPQTGPKGREVTRVYIEEGCEIARELYLGALVDREAGRVSLIVSPEGGVDIEEVAAKSPEKIHKLAIDPATGLLPFQARKLARRLELSGKTIGAATKFFLGIYEAFVGLDASLVEINPMVVTKSGEVLALDAKMSFDDSALFRHRKIAELREESEEDPAEREAERHGLSYVKLDGNIGCMVNGAGLAMATMDIIKLYGGEPANFLDVGGTATRERVAEAFKLILADRDVEAVLINIFGGIIRCDVVAEGIVQAAQALSVRVPLVARLEGTNVEKGRRILSQSGLAILNASDLADAAARTVNAARKAA